MLRQEHWDDFAALSDLPILAIRGAKSDILSPRSSTKWRDARRAWSEPGRRPGHAPLLLDQPTITRITDFVRKCP